MIIWIIDYSICWEVTKLSQVQETAYSLSMSPLLVAVLVFDSFAALEIPLTPAHAALFIADSQRSLSLAVGFALLREEGPQATSASSLTSSSWGWHVLLLVAAFFGLRTTSLLSAHSLARPIFFHLFCTFFQFVD